MLKCTAFYTLGNAGWSETLFRDGTNLATGQSALQALVTARLGLCSNTVTNTFTRVTNPDNPSIVDTRRRSQSGALSDARDFTNAALFAKAFTESGNKRFLVIRGIPDLTVTGGNYTPQPAFATAYTAWINRLISDSWSLRSQDRVNNPVVAVSGVSATAHLTLFGGQPWQVGDRVKFFRTRDTLGKAVTGVWEIVKVDSNVDFTLNGWTAGRIVTKGKVRRYALINDPINFVNTSPQPLTRKTGRPFGSPVGRSRSRV